MYRYRSRVKCSLLTGFCRSLFLPRSGTSIPKCQRGFAASYRLKENMLYDTHGSWREVFAIHQQTARRVALLAFYMLNLSHHNLCFAFRFLSLCLRSNKYCIIHTGTYHVLASHACRLSTYRTKWTSVHTVQCTYRYVSYGTNTSFHTDKYCS